VPQPVLVQQERRPGVAVALDVTGRLRIPCRTAAERKARAWTAPEVAAIAQELRVGRITVISRGRSGLPERTSFADRESASVAFYVALQRVRAAA
jgi:hypothetical protein